MSNAAGVTIRRHVHGPGVDEALLTYEGAGLADKRYLHADERGSIVAVSNGSGSVKQINAYDEYGIPQGKDAAGALFAGGTATPSFGRFGYTGQVWLPEIGLNYYKNRIYSPTLGRFMQADPIGYEDGVNLYAYVGGDPVNNVDPSGLGAVSRDVDPRKIIPIDCPTGFICVRAFDAPDPSPRGLGFLLSANRPGDRGTSNLGERNDGGAGAPGTPPTAPPEMPKNKFDPLKCLGKVALGGLGGALTPVNTLIELTGAVGGAANRTAPEDASFSSKKWPRLRRDIESSLRIGAKRVLSAAIASPQARLISGGFAGALVLLSSDSCGIQAINPPASITPPGF